MEDTDVKRHLSPPPPPRIILCRKDNDAVFDVLAVHFEKMQAANLFKITGYAKVLDDEKVIFEDKSENSIEIQYVLVASSKFFLVKKSLLEVGFPESIILDGRVFQIPGFDVYKFLSDGTVEGILPIEESFSDLTMTVYSRFYRNHHVHLRLGRKSYIGSCKFAGCGYVSIGDFSSISKDVVFEIGGSSDHNYKSVSSYGLTWHDWTVPANYWKKENKFGNIKIGSDVWIGHGARIKSIRHEDPVVIGDGAIVASDSVVVKSVPAFAIVGGNPAKVIKYRFSEENIRKLCCIQWWNKDMEWIYQHFGLFNDVQLFLEKVANEVK